MGRPISNKFLGSAVGKLRIKFHNGTSVVYGYITRQLGSNKYEVSVDGTTKQIVTLAQTTALASSLTSGFATLEATVAGSTVYVSKLMAFTAVTTDGQLVIWSDSPASNAVLSTIPTPATLTIVVSTVGNQTSGVQFTVSGTFTGAAPTKLRVKTNAGSYTTVVSPTIGAGVFSFPVTVTPTGQTTITVQDYSNNVAGVSGASAAFTVG